MEKDQKITGFDAVPVMEVGSFASPQVGDVEEIRRDMKSRHINMIALAGMIVSHRSQRYTA